MLGLKNGNILYSWLWTSYSECQNQNSKSEKLGLGIDELAWTVEIHKWPIHRPWCSIGSIDQYWMAGLNMADVSRMRDREIKRILINKTYHFGQNVFYYYFLFLYMLSFLQITLYAVNGFSRRWSFHAPLSRMTLFPPWLHLRTSFHHALHICVISRRAPGVRLALSRVQERVQQTQEQQPSFICNESWVVGALVTGRPVRVIKTYWHTWGLRAYHGWVPIPSWEWCVHSHWTWITCHNYKSDRIGTYIHLYIVSINDLSVRTFLDHFLHFFFTLWYCTLLITVIFCNWYFSCFCNFIFGFQQFSDLASSWRRLLCSV